MINLNKWNTDIQQLYVRSARIDVFKIDWLVILDFICMLPRFQRINQYYVAIDFGHFRWWCNLNAYTYMAEIIYHSCLVCWAIGNKTNTNKSGKTNKIIVHHRPDIFEWLFLLLSELEDKVNATRIHHF